MTARSEERHTFVDLLGELIRMNLDGLHVIAWGLAGVRLRPCAP